MGKTLSIIAIATQVTLLIATNYNQYFDPFQAEQTRGRRESILRMKGAQREILSKSSNPRAKGYQTLAQRQLQKQCANIKCTEACCVSEKNGEPVIFCANLKNPVEYNAQINAMIANKEIDKSPNCM